MSRFVALDFETSGLDSKRHFPVSIGLALFDGDQPVSTFESLIAPPQKNGKVTREYDVFALRISGITLAQLMGARQADGVMMDIRAWVRENQAGDLPVVAFNAPFDFGFYSELLFSVGNWNSHTRSFESFTPPLYGPWHCARLLAMNMVRLDAYSLDSVSAHFGLAREGDKHGSLEDAILAGLVFSRLTHGQEVAA